MEKILGIRSKLQDLKLGSCHIKANVLVSNGIIEDTTFPIQEYVQSNFAEKIANRIVGKCALTADKQVQNTMFETELFVFNKEELIKLVESYGVKFAEPRVIRQ